MKTRTKYWIVYFILIVFIILSFSCSEQYDDEYYLDCKKYNDWVERSYKERLSRCNKCTPKYIKSVEKWRVNALKECE